MTDAAPCPAELVAMAGRALYGADWQAPLSRFLNVQLRTVQRVAAAAADGRDYPAALAWLPDLAAELETHRGRLAALKALIDRA